MVARDLLQVRGTMQLNAGLICGDTVYVNGSISGRGRGCAAGQGLGAGQGASGNSGGGAGHANTGGTGGGPHGGAGGSAYGNLTLPVHIGSGGAPTRTGGAGGGFLALEARNLQIYNLTGPSPSQQSITPLAVDVRVCY